MKHTPYLVAFLPLAAAWLVACDSASTSAPLPTYTPPAMDGSAIYAFDTGTPGESGGGKDAAHDSGHDTSTPADAGHDAGHDGATPSDTGVDATATDAGVDTGTPDATGTDASGGTDASDAAAATDTGGAACVSDADTCPPVCMNVGTATEGWYSASGTLLCTHPCAGAPSTCEHKGTPQQGWYTSNGHGCPPHSTEIVNDPTCQ